MTALVDYQAFLESVQSRQSARRHQLDPSHGFPPQPPLAHQSHTQLPTEPIAGPSKLNVINYVPAEETIRNDLAAWYGRSGQYGSNYILGAGDDEICEECVTMADHAR